MASLGQPPLPPEVAQQAPARRAFDMSPEAPDNPPDPKMGMLMMLGQNIQALDRGVEETAKMISQIHPPMASFLMPVKQGIEAMKKEFVQLAQRTGAGGQSPVSPEAPPPNPGQGPEMGAVPPGQ